MKIVVVILTLQASRYLDALLAGLKRQSRQPDKVLVVDSESTDETVAIARRHGCQVLSVERQTFNHGTTRTLALTHIGDADVVIFLTQDVIWAGDDSLEALIAPFANDRVAVSYGRQLPHLDASPLAAQNRLFNYPPNSEMRSYEDRFRLGIKTPFTSDSFSAYRVTPLREIGAFPYVIVSEDMYVAAKLLQAGYKVAYAADACVYHSHDYTLAQEFQRYFDIGVFMSREAWIGEAFGCAAGEGLKLVKNQLAYLRHYHGWSSLPRAIAVNMVKAVSYKIGFYERFIPSFLKKKLSGQAYFFKDERKRRQR